MSTLASLTSVASLAHTPVVGLSLASTGADLVPLLAAMRRWCDPRVLARAERPVALILDGLNESQRELARSSGLPYVVASRDPAVLAEAGPAGVYPPDGSSADGARYFPPFIRARLREERGLPPAVLRPDRHWPGRGVLSEEAFETAMACAAVAIADTNAFAERALAWGTPLICDAATAGALGLTDGVNTLVDGDPDAVLGDPRLAARLSWAGRCVWEHRHDAEGLAAELAVRLLPSGPTTGQLQLAALGTPPEAEILNRLRAVELL